GAYTVRVFNDAGSVTSAPPASLSIISSKPVITTQPLSQTALFGAPVNFSVAALGNAPLSYQWQQNGVNLNNGGNISGATSANLVLAAASSTSAGTYTVVITNALGSSTSTGAVLTVYALSDSQLIQNGSFETGNFASWTLSGNTALTSVSSD